MYYGKNPFLPIVEFIDRQICLIKSELPGSTVRKLIGKIIFIWSIFYQTHL